jgi:hypothetical protein
MASPERVHEGAHYEVIDSAELARRWVLWPDLLLNGKVREPF